MDTWVITYIGYDGQFETTLVEAEELRWEEWVFLAVPNYALALDRFVSATVHDDGSH